MDSPNDGFGEVLTMNGREVLPTGHHGDPVPMLVLSWSSGTRAAEEGNDLASVLRRLPDDRLAYWRDRFDRKACPYERRLCDAETARRERPSPRADARGQLLLF